MGIRDYFTTILYLPLFDIALGYHIEHYLRFLGDSQFWTFSELCEFQNERLRIIISNAYYNTEFYNELMKKSKLRPDDIKTIDDLHKLPILNKQTIRDGIRNGKLVNNSINARKTERSSSSGSTGEPLQFTIDKEAVSMYKASALRSWHWMGYSLGKKILRINYLHRTKLLKRLQDRATNNVYALFHRLDEDELQFITNLIQQEKPYVLRCYPEPLVVIAKYIKKNKIHVNGLVDIISTTGSNLLPESRQLIEETFNCKVYDAYSCEGGAVVAECSYSNTYHSAMEYAVSEILDSSGSPSTIGRLITTDLWNLSCPFIRYDTQDVVELDANKCPCNRGLLQIKRIFGRETDAVITPNRGFLWATTFAGIFQDFSEIDQFQVIQDTPSSIQLKLKVNSLYKRQTEQTVIETIRELTGNDMIISIKIVKEIPLTPNGKRRFIIRADSISL